MLEVLQKISLNISGFNIGPAKTLATRNRFREVSAGPKLAADQSALRGPIGASGWMRALLLGGLHVLEIHLLRPFRRLMRRSAKAGLPTLPSPYALIGDEMP
jgi:hypothetical protein